MISAQARQGVEGEMMKTRSANFALSGWKGSCWLELSRICQQFLVDLSPIQVLIGSIGLVGNSLSIYIFSTVGMMMMIGRSSLLNILSVWSGALAYPSAASPKKDNATQGNSRNAQTPSNKQTNTTIKQQLKLFA